MVAPLARAAHPTIRRLSDNSLALLSNGTVMAWGYNGSGELGDGGTTGPETCGSSACSKTPVPVPGLSNVVAIAASYYYNLALLADGTVVTWGYDYYGELGDGVGIQSGCDCVDHPVPVPGVSGATAIAAGEYLASALLQDGTVKDWGYNYYGEVGNGTTTTTTSCGCVGPVSVSGLAGVRAIASGGYLGLALLANGSLMSWGENGSGQLGVGNNTGPEECETYACSKFPVPVGGLSGVQAIAAGYYDGLALLGDGTVRAWGENGYGELGDGTETERPAPVAVSGVSGASAITASDYTSFALIGPSQTLNVALAGAGAGTVGGHTILCPSSCTSPYPQGRVEILRAAPAPGSGFAGFSGPCTGTGNCQVTMGTDQTVTATFGAPKGTAITKATIKKSKSKSKGKGKGKAKGKRTATATFSFSAPGAITGYECALIKPKPKPKHHKNHKPKGHKVVKRATLKKQLPHFVACAAPKVYKNLKPGKYTFEVRALDILGADATPAIAKFKISHPHRP